VTSSGGAVGGRGASTSASGRSRAQPAARRPGDGCQGGQADRRSARRDRSSAEGSRVRRGSSVARPLERGARLSCGTTWAAGRSFRSLQGAGRFAVPRYGAGGRTFGAVGDRFELARGEVCRKLLGARRAQTFRDEEAQPATGGSPALGSCWMFSEALERMAGVVRGRQRAMRSLIRVEARGQVWPERGLRSQPTRGPSRRTAGTDAAIAA
jgi:hypothetical protein